MPNIGDSKPSRISGSYKPRECYNPLGSPKFRYASKSEAKSALKKMTHRTRLGVPMQRNAQVYRCTVCKTYHIGHKK
jgi:hypothetical protein